MARGRKMQNLCYRDIKAPNIIPKVEFTTRSFIPTRILQDNMKKFVKGGGTFYKSEQGTCWAKAKLEETWPKDHQKKQNFTRALERQLH